MCKELGMLPTENNISADWLAVQWNAVLVNDDTEFSLTTCRNSRLRSFMLSTQLYKPIEILVYTYLSTFNNSMVALQSCNSSMDSS